MTKVLARRVQASYIVGIMSGDPALLRPRSEARWPFWRYVLRPWCAIVGHRPPAGVVIVEERRIGWTCYDCERCGGEVTVEYD